jgi:hypothetical protein
LQGVHVRVPQHESQAHRLALMPGQRRRIAPSHLASHLIPAISRQSAKPNPGNGMPPASCTFTHTLPAAPVLSRDDSVGREVMAKQMLAQAEE